MLHVELGGTRCQRTSFIDSSFIDSHQRTSSRASTSVLGSPVAGNKPYQIVPSVYVFGFLYRVVVVSETPQVVAEAVAREYAPCSPHSPA
jgi:hypothetical protein